MMTKMMKTMKENWSMMKTMKTTTMMVNWNTMMTSRVHDG